MRLERDRISKMRKGGQDEGKSEKREGGGISDKDVCMPYASKGDELEVNQQEQGVDVEERVRREGDVLEHASG